MSNEEQSRKQIRDILFGASGMIGDGLLLECLENPLVKDVLVIGRKSCNRKHEKLKEIIHQDLHNIKAIEYELKGYDACFFSIGITSVGLTEEQYLKITHSIALHVAEVILAQNKDLTFCFVSGSGTDSTEKGKIMWARVKGKAENDLMKLPFKKVYCFRPGFLYPLKGQNNIHTSYKLLGWLYPIARSISPRFVSTMKEMAVAMIHAVTLGYEKQVLEVKDMVELAGRKSP